MGGSSSNYNTIEPIKDITINDGIIIGYRNQNSTSTDLPFSPRRISFQDFIPSLFDLEEFTTLLNENVTGGTVDGTGDTNEVTFWSDTDTITSDSKFTYTDSVGRLRNLDSGGTWDWILDRQRLSISADYAVSYTADSYGSGGEPDSSKLILKSSRGTKASPAFLETSDYLARTCYTAHSTISDVDSVIIDIEATENHSNSARGASYKIRTTANGESAATERFLIDGDGAIVFNAAFKFPTADGTTGQILQTDGAGNLTWITPTAGGAEEDPVFKAHPAFDITDGGDGNSYLANDGEYKVIPVGQTNTASNLSTHTGTGIYDSKVGSDLKFKKLLAGNNVTITEDGPNNEIVIGATFTALSSKLINSETGTNLILFSRGGTLNPPVNISGDVVYSVVTRSWEAISVTLNFSVLVGGMSTTGDAFFQTKAVDNYITLAAPSASPSDIISATVKVETNDGIHYNSVAEFNRFTGRFKISFKDLLSTTTSLDVKLTAVSYYDGT